MFFFLKSGFTGGSIERGIAMRYHLLNHLVKVLGITMTKYGTLPKEAGLLVVNHRSYLDPIVILTDLLCIPVAKIQVRSWPIIGWACRITGVLFVDRSSKKGRSRIRNDINEFLHQDYSILNFPEGTTHIQNQTLPFKPALFKDAAKGNFNVFPIAIEYQNMQDAWVDDDTFLRHFFQCFGKKKTNIKISYGPKMRSDDADVLLRKSKEWIDGELMVLREGWYDKV